MVFLSPSKVIKRKEPKRPFSRLFRVSAWPLRVYASLGFSLSLGIVLLFLSRSASPMTVSFQKTLLEVSGRLFSFLNAIEREWQAFEKAIIHRNTWAAEKSTLETEVLGLRQQLVFFENVAQENKTLRKLLNVVQRPEEKFITALVISPPSQGLDHTFLIGAGALQGVQKGQPVLSPYGVIGQVSDVGEKTSRIMPLTHRDARTPVVGVSSRVEAIVAGDGSPLPVLTYLQENKPVIPAEIFVTSRYGGNFPSGYIVGRLLEDKAGHVRIHPFVLWDRLEFVQVITAFSFEAPKEENARWNSF